jgi:hypothetical protein
LPRWGGCPLPSSLLSAVWGAYSQSAGWFLGLPLCLRVPAPSFRCMRGGVPHCVQKPGPWGGAACFLVRHPVGVYGCAALPFCNTRLQPKLRSRGSCVYVRSFFCSVFFSALCLILLSQLCSCAVFRFYLPPPGPWRVYQGGRCSKDAPSVSDVAGLMGMSPGCVLEMVRSCGCAGARGVPFFLLHTISHHRLGRHHRGK